jgi:hypothetical protein
MGQQESEYNGELKKLYNDLVKLYDKTTERLNEIDKRVALVESNAIMAWQNHEKEARIREVAAEEFRKYLHVKVHDFNNTAMEIKLRLSTLPCDVRKEHNTQEEKAVEAKFKELEKTADMKSKWLDTHLYGLWTIHIISVSGLIGLAWKVLWSR